MFTLDPGFTHLAVTSDRVLCVLASINALTVKVPNMPMEPAIATAVIWTASPGMGSAVAGLYYDQALARSTYVREPALFPLSELDDVVAEARDFLESMGFLLDDVGFRSRSPEEQLNLMTRTSLFHADLAAFQKARLEPSAALIPEAELEPLEAEEVPANKAPPSAVAQALGRLLASL